MTRKGKLGIAAAAAVGIGAVLYAGFKDRPKAPPVPVSIFPTVNNQAPTDYTAWNAPAMGLRGLVPAVPEP